MVYATCTFHPEENEEQVKHFLAGHPEFEPESFRLPGADGAEGWFTCWPHRSPGEGQFAALLRKKGDRPARLPGGGEAFRVPREERGAWQAAGLDLPEPNALFGRTLVSAPEIPDLKGIRVLRLGLHLGLLRKALRKLALHLALNLRTTRRTESRAVAYLIPALWTNHGKTSRLGRPYLRLLPAMGVQLHG